MKAIKKPIPIEVVVFDPLGPGHPGVKIGAGAGTEYKPAVWNALHQSWIGLSPGDYLNVTNPKDIYPIAKAVFETTYEVVEE